MRSFSDCEVLLPKIAKRGDLMLRAMVKAAPEVGVRCTVSDQYRGEAPLLMSYGLGHLERRRWTEAHVANGGRLIGWDMGYWDRDVAMRCTVDHGHPHRLIRDMPGDRWSRAGIALRSHCNMKGPILLVGMGVKSRQQFGFQGQEWELRTLAAIRAVTKREVLYRPKKPENLHGCRNANGAIHDALRGASLVVCRHSNVAVDACIAGVPVICEDGAAAALYGSALACPVNPSEAERLRFLQNLAWWQWKPEEAVQAWRFLLKVLGST